MNFVNERIHKHHSSLRPRRLTCPKSDWSTRNERNVSAINRHLGAGHSEIDYSALICSLLMSTWRFLFDVMVVAIYHDRAQCSHLRLLFLISWNDLERRLERRGIAAISARNPSPQRQHKKHTPRDGSLSHDWAGSKCCESKFNRTRQTFSHCRVSTSISRIIHLIVFDLKIAANQLTEQRAVF